MTRHPPQDKFRAVWLIFFTLGLGTLLPWNFFMTATMYFTGRLADPLKDGELVNKTANATVSVPPNYLQLRFNNFLTLCAMLPLLIFTCLNSFLHQKVPQNLRIMGSLIAIFLVFVFTAAFVKIPMAPMTFFVLTMLKIVFINSFGAILQGSLFGLAGLLPATYTAPIMSGQGMAGTFAALAMICAIASGSKMDNSAFGYFVTACVVILFAIISYIVLPKLEFFRFYSMKIASEHNLAENSAEETKLKEESNGVEKKASIPLEESQVAETNEKPSVISIFRKIWVMALSVCLVFAVTIGTFPAVTVDVKSTVAGGDIWEKYFIPVSCFLLFNVFDWAGRSLTAVFLWPGKNSKLLPIFVVCRVVFIPLFMLCNVQPRTNIPVLFAHDAWYIIFMIFFSFSNGYLASLCMCFGPKKVGVQEAETAGTIMAFFLSLGLALGAALSFLFRGII
ncbi:equilibrative nucleoside transporter 1 [Latimeria chalumnae]|uniref:equilibrative nucleoside transporter 1 n=1 Tax=Latimeria chalumnae TaxID=7897 RepID=UPI0006D9408A|nr:PREDICTED: equilibrative nucleoside transporter 1 [Latimeria chalumnae]|eukprot:XP_006005994.2 PREDICTED: equilibrative nucleoside transporter 1 [Latimeria chalumnae]